MKVATLSIESAPPYAMPLRWMAFAPVFLGAAGVILLGWGPDVFVSRWHPTALALTHAFVLGFMGATMLGALLQVIPVLTAQGWNERWRLAWWPPWLFALGVGLLLGHFFGFGGLVVAWAAGGVLLVVLAMYLGHAFAVLVPLWRRSEIAQGLGLSVLGLAVTLLFGLALLAKRVGLWAWGDPLAWVDAHVAVAWLGWGLTLVATVGYVVVPMFQLTPSYSPVFRRRCLPLLWLTLLLGAIWRLAGGGSEPLVVFAWAMSWAWAAQTLALQAQRRRSKDEPTRRLWRNAMIAVMLSGPSALLASLEVVSPYWPAVLVLWGGFAAVIFGMWVKIVPFLTWLHLQQLPNRTTFPPTMLQITPIVWARRLELAHGIALGLLLLAIPFPEPLARASGLAVLVSAGLSAWVLWSGWHLFHDWQRRYGQAIVAGSGKEAE